MQITRNTIMALIALSLAACGDSGGSGSTGTGGATGSGGATGTGGSMSGTGGAGGSMTGTGGAGGNAGPVCGGAMGTACAADEWCEYDIPGSCGAAETTGICKPRPQNCTEECPGVCGCDGQFYCNACLATSAGTDVGGSSSCAPPMSGPNATYTANNLFNAIPRFVIFKADTVRDVCARIQVEAGSAMPFDIVTTTGWVPYQAEITDHADDCKLVNGYPAAPIGTKVSAEKGNGTLTVNGQNPCAVDVHVKLSFPAGSPAWVPSLGELFSVDGLDVAGGCQ